MRALRRSALRCAVASQRGTQPDGFPFGMSPGLIRSARKTAYATASDAHPRLLPVQPERRHAAEEPPRSSLSPRTSASFRRQVIGASAERRGCATCGHRAVSNPARGQAVYSASGALCTRNGEGRRRFRGVGLILQCRGGAQRVPRLAGIHLAKCDGQGGQLNSSGKRSMLAAFIKPPARPSYPREGRLKKLGRRS